MLDTRFSMLDTRFSMLDTECENKGIGLSGQQVVVIRKSGGKFIILYLLLRKISLTQYAPLFKEAALKSEVLVSAQVLP